MNQKRNIYGPRMRATSEGWLIGEKQGLSADALTFCLRVFMRMA
jgi:hypothetical protein